MKSSPLPQPNVQPSGGHPRLQPATSAPPVSLGRMSELSPGIPGSARIHPASSRPNPTPIGLRMVKAVQIPSSAPPALRKRFAGNGPHTTEAQHPSQEPGRCRRRRAPATRSAIVQLQATRRHKKGPGVGPSLLKKACWETRQWELCGWLSLWGWTVSAKCQERISDRLRLSAKPFNPCDSTYLAKPPVHAKQESSDDGVGDKAVAEDASGTKL
jgi:hypothetical protein